MSARLVLVTCPDAEMATSLARSLVEERLAACVGVLPGLVSVYRWEGAVEQAAEVQLLAKTWDDRVEALTRHVRERHPYELPEVIVVDVAGGLDRYLAWLHAETRIPA